MSGTQMKYISPVLTQAAVRFTPPALMGMNLFVPRPVQKESGIWYKWDKSEFDAPNSKRSNGGESNETGSGFKEENYFCQQYALKEGITDRDRENADDAVQLETRAAELVKGQVLNSLERKIFSSGGYIQDATKILTSTTLTLTNLATATPRTDFDQVKNSMFQASGVEPNEVYIGNDILRNIMRTDEYREEFKFVTDIRNADLPSELYGMKTMLVGGLTTGNFKRGAAKTLARVLGNTIFCAYNDPSEGSKILTYGRLFMSKEYTNRWYDPARETTWIEYNTLYDPVVVAKECGIRIDVTP